MRERRNLKSEQDIPVMCSGCKGFFSKVFKARHQVNCPASGINVMVPVVSINSVPIIQQYPDDFKELLTTLLLDEIGNYVKTDQIILMVGMRSFNSLRRKKDKVVEGKKTVRSRMRLLARLYLKFLSFYNQQTNVIVIDLLGNAADLYRKESMHLLGSAINKLCEDQGDKDLNSLSISGQKSGLKIGILNLLKSTSQILIGHFLIECQDTRSNRVVEFLKVLKLFENEIFGDAYYDLNYRRNRSLRKPINLPKDDDVRLLIDECKSIMGSIDIFDHPADAFVQIRSATATALIIFCARRGGEPVRLQIYQWLEAVNGEWVQQQDLPEDFDMKSMLITYQTGKGADHLVPVIFPYETIACMKYLTDETIRQDAGVHKDNPYIFASTQKSQSHASGWHCINDILKRLCLKGALNATKNRHRVASLLAKLELTKKEQDLIFQHFGHSKQMNEDVYQAPPGSLQLQTTGQYLLEINPGFNNEMKHVAAANGGNDIKDQKGSHASPGSLQLQTSDQNLLETLTKKMQCATSATKDDIKDQKDLKVLHKDLNVTKHFHGKSTLATKDDIKDKKASKVLKKDLKDAKNSYGRNTSAMKDDVKHMKDSKVLKKDSKVTENSHGKSFLVECFPWFLKSIY